MLFFNSKNLLKTLYVLQINKKRQAVSQDQSVVPSDNAQCHYKCCNSIHSLIQHNSQSACVENTSTNTSPNIAHLLFGFLELSLLLLDPNDKHLSHVFLLLLHVRKMLLLLLLVCFLQATQQRITSHTVLIWFKNFR